MKQETISKGTVLVPLLILLLVVVSLSGRYGIYFIGILFAGIAVSLFISALRQIPEMVKRRISPASGDFPLRFMSTLMGIVFMTGALLYLYVFWFIANNHSVRTLLNHEVEYSNIEYLIRSLICSFDLFMLRVDSTVLVRLDGHAALRGCLYIQAVVSFFCTMSMLVGLIYSRAKAYLKLNFNTRINNGSNHLYLFFGDNTPSALLMRDVVRHDPKAVVIVIEKAAEDEAERNAKSRVMGFLALRKGTFSHCHTVGARVAVSTRMPKDIALGEAEGEETDIFCAMGLSRISKFLNKLVTTDKPQVHLFFTDEDEDSNILNVLSISRDRNLHRIAANPDSSHQIYCFVREHGAKCAIGDIALESGLNIKMVDSSAIAVQMLKTEVCHHPVNVVDVSEGDPATVSTPFRALLVGFGEVGHDAFRFLYEFGSFVAAGTDGHRSKFECTVVDRNLDVQRGAFCASMPAIFASEKPESVEVHFCSMDCNHHDFYSSVLSDEFLIGLNYVVISIPDSEEAMGIAIRIFEGVRCLSTDLSHLHICVYCNDAGKVEYLQRLARHYNFGYGKKSGNIPVIHIFGYPEQIYTYDLIVSDKILNAGKKFHEEYRMLSGGTRTWDERHRALATGALPMLDNLRKLRRQEAQDLANALHAATKNILIDKSFSGSEEKREFTNSLFNSDGTVMVEGRNGSIHYPALSLRGNKIMLRLAQLEHLRWVAAHELLGYSYGLSCDERTMTHNCLCSWAELDDETRWAEDYKRYDFAVVETTLALLRNSD